MKEKFLKTSKRFGCLALSLTLFVLSFSVNVNAASHTHNFISTPYFNDTALGHILTCSTCGETTGEVENHAISSSRCTVCGHGRKNINPTADGSYFAQAVMGINNSDMYRYNLGSTGITNPTGSNPYGMNSYVNGKENAVFADFQNLSGTGIESDPYVINDALTLYKVLSSGGTNYSTSLYFKLGCDIALGDKQWVDMDERWISTAYVAYKYKAWNGSLDGDGHTITGLYSSGDDISAGFIPVLGNTGVVKNLHIKNASVNTTNANGGKGVLVGTAVDGSQIIGCSAEDSGSTTLVGKAYGSVKNSYVITNSGSTYYNADGNIVSANQITGDAWYKGANEVPRLINRAVSESLADIDGDGLSDTYGAADIVALKNHLMWADGYENVYGDVDKNGITDITDLAVLQRYMVGDYSGITDGFWRNIELNKFGIYYLENDNLDFARKLELYFKNGIGVEVKKQKAAAPSQYAITLKKDSTLNADYKISYDNQNAVLTISGKNFTAVEQAVLDFIANSDYKTSTVYQTSSGTLPAEKQSVTVNGKQYYYAWGDEFDEGSVLGDNTTVNYGLWNVRDMGSDNSVGNGNGSVYSNLKFADDIGLSELNEVKDGKLIMHRGVGYGAEHLGEKSGILTSTNTSVAYDANDIATSGVLYTKHSMLFKRGYLEMQCTLPSDGYAFPAWWLMFNAGNNNPEIDDSLYNKVYELNEDYDKAFYYTPDNYKTYKYKTPGATYEIDIFEIIQYPTLIEGDYVWGSGYTYFATPNQTHKLQYTLHKWYIHSKTVRGNNLPLKVYELDWASNYKINGFTQILDATYGSSGYTKNWGSLSCNTSNMAGGQVNADITRNGNKTSKYPRSSLDELYSVDSNNQVNAKVGLLWDETQITQYVWFEGSTSPVTNKIDISDLGYDGAGFDIEQYAHMLMENHLFTNNTSGNKPSSYIGLNDCTMVIDYVRLYQLDGHRDIVTPETEAFNNPINRFN